jgi:hypothetical protein
MKWNVWLKSVAGSACAVLALSGAAAVEAQAVYTPDRPPVEGSRTYANARVVRIDMKARTITVRGGGVGPDETFPVEAQALQRIGALKKGDPVVLTLRAGGAGREVVTQVERAAAPGRTSGRAVAQRQKPAVLAPSPGEPTPRTPSAPVASPRPSPGPTVLPTDIVGPFRDPRVDPNFDPRQDPLRDPRVIPGLSEPAPRPAPSPSPN